MREIISFGVRLMLMLSVPASVGLMVLAVPIVELIFQHGAFGPSDTQKVATALLFYAPAIAGYSIVKIAGPSFYSLQDSRTPVIVSLITIASNLLLNLWLNSILGFRGLALGTAIAANINAGLLLILLGRRIGGVDGSRIALSFGKDCRRVGAHGSRRALLGAVAARPSTRRRTPDTSRARRRRDRRQPRNTRGRRVGAADSRVPRGGGSRLARRKPQASGPTASGP